MAPNRQSWSSVEEKLQTDIAKWKSNVLQIPRQEEERALVEGALVMPTGKGVATMRMGKLEWELTPPSNYTGYCEMNDDWLLVSGSGFRVAFRSTFGTRLLQVCPQSDEVELLGSQALLPMSMLNVGLREGSHRMNVSISSVGVDDKLSNSLLALLFDTREATISSSHKKAEIIGEKFSVPFLRCVSDLQTAKSILDVLETILGLSAAYDLTQEALQQDQQETFDLTGSFYNEQVWEKDCSRKNGSLWVRQQVNHAAMKCQTAAAATSEVAEVGAGILVDLYIKPSEVAHAFQFNKDDRINREFVENLSDSEMDECSDEVNPNSTTSLPFDQGGLMNGSPSISTDLKLSATPQHWDSEYFGSGAAILDGPLLNPLPSSQDGDQFGIGDFGDRNNPTGTLLRTSSFGSSWQSDVGNDTCSESSWEVVRSSKNESNVEDEADVLGAEFSDAESLDVMLRDLDPFGKHDCSPLINEFLNLNMNSGTCKADDSDQENSSYVQEERESKVLRRLASWSSSNSGSWTDHDILSSASSVKKMRAAPLETLAEEPACDPQISRLYRYFVFCAASEGNVLQWCSCKFNKLRCSIELKFQVGSFMEDDIATISTGISRESLLHVEIFLDSTNVRESLLKGDVRVSAHQGVPFGYRESWKHAGDKTTALPPVAGLSCYIPHLVRQYLKQEVHVKRSSSGYEFPDGELLTGLMQYVVAQLVFIKHTCCVCNHETPSDVLTSIVPIPCEKNLCQALYGAWLVVAPPLVLELSTIVDWLKACFDEGPLHEAFMRHYMTHQDAWTGTYEEKVQRVANWLTRTKLAGSWLKIAPPKPKTDEIFEDSEASEKPENGTPWPGLSDRTIRDSMTQATKRRRTLILDDDESRNLCPQTVSSPPVSPIVRNDVENHHGFSFGPGERIGNFVLDDFSPMTSSPQTPKEPNVLRARPPSLSEQNGEKASTSACPLSRTSPQAHGEMSFSTWQGLVEESVASASRHPKRSPAEAQGETSSSQGDQDGGWKRILEDFEPLSLKEESVSSAGPPKRSPAQAQGESSSQGDQDWGWKNILADLEPLSLKEKSVTSTRLPKRNSGKLRFVDFWKLAKRTPPQSPGKSTCQEKTRISPQPQEESSSKGSMASSWEDLIDED